MYRGVIFDLDGVLADTEGFYNRRREEYLAVIGFHWPGSTDFTGLNETAMWETIVPEDGELRQELLMGYRAYRRFHPTPFRELANPQMVPLFRTLKARGLKLGVASSSDEEIIDQLLETMEVEDLVDFRISGRACRAYKPDPEIYLRALEALGLSAGEAMAVEDSPAGILSARRAGLTVLALRPQGGSAPGPVPGGPGHRPAQRRSDPALSPRGAGEFVGSEEKRGKNSGEFVNFSKFLLTAERN